MAPDGTAAARPAASEPAVAAGRGNVGRIPIRNIWLLMLYASRLYRELPPARRVAVEDNPDEIPDLVAQLLTRAVERRLRRNLNFAFQEPARTCGGCAAASTCCAPNGVICCGGAESPAGTRN